MNEHDDQLRKSLRYRLANCERAALAAQRRVNAALHQRAELAARLAELDAADAIIDEPAGAGIPTDARSGMERILADAREAPDAGA